MKRLILPLLLVLASLVVAAIFTTVTAVTFASYSPGDKSAIIINQPLTQSSQSTVQR